MTAQEELTLWEAALTAAATRNGATQVTIAGRSTMYDLKFITSRVDLLRAIVARQTTGMAWAGQFRPKE